MSEVNFIMQDLFRPARATRMLALLALLPLVLFTAACQGNRGEGQEAAAQATPAPTLVLPSSATPTPVPAVGSSVASAEGRSYTGEIRGKQSTGLAPKVAG